MTKPKLISELSIEQQLDLLIHLHRNLKNDDDFYYATYMRYNIEEIIKDRLEKNKAKLDNDNET